MEDLYLKMNGSAFDEGFRLDKMIAGLSGTQQVVEGVYKGVTGKSRLSKKDREQYKVVAYKVENRCLFVTFGAIFSGIQQAMPFIASTSPDQMWEYTKAAAQYLHEIFMAAHSGENISIEHSPEAVAVIHKGENNQTNIYKGPIQIIGIQIVNGLRRLDDALEEGQVSKIELGAKYEKDPAIIMPFEEKGLYYPPTTVDNQPKTLRCDIYDFNKYEKEGRLRVVHGDGVPKGKYKFRVVGRQEVEDFILSMTETEVEIHCLVEYEHDPLKETTIGALLIMDVIA